MNNHRVKRGSNMMILAWNLLPLKAPYNWLHVPWKKMDEVSSSVLLGFLGMFLFSPNQISTTVRKFQTFIPRDPLSLKMSMIPDEFTEVILVGWLPVKSWCVFIVLVVCFRSIFPSPATGDLFLEVRWAEEKFSKCFLLLMDEILHQLIW